MSSKLLVIIATSDREKALTAMMYTANAIRYKWIVEDAEVAARAEEVSELCETVACKFLSDRDETSEQTAELGIKVDYVGALISGLIKEGFTPMVW
ncbi:MAG: hypothetical protein ACW975_12490 [Candidatus Thorarchaeota archaeon]|jgi:hypothetical protein